jgi:hypothetical protein
MKNEIAFRPQTRPGKIIILNIRRLAGIKVIRPRVSFDCVFLPDAARASQLYAAEGKLEFLRLGLTIITHKLKTLSDGNSVYATEESD